MQNLLNPKWLIILNTLPVLLLIFIFWSDFTIIHTLLTDDSITLWKTFCLVLVLLTIINLAYAVTAIVKRKNLSIYYASVSLVIYIIFIYSYSLYSNDILPREIPDWMLTGDLFIYVGTFLMPTLAHSLFIIVLKFTPKDKDHKAWKNILGAIVVPIACYAFFQIIMPLWRVVGTDFGTHVMIILSITVVLLFLFLIIRGIYILSIKKGKAWKKYELFWKIPIAILLPILGLAVNNGFIIDELNFNNTGVFGNFSNYWFYALALLNGILICLPNKTNTIYRLLLFVGRSIMFAYTFYFFIVFLPYLPLSIVAIIAIGLGFLMLTPLVLFIIHVQQLAADFAFLKTYFSKQLLLSISLVGFLFIPLCITISYTNDRMVLHETLDYIYNPNYSKHYEIDKLSLQKTLTVVSKNKDRNDSGFLSTRGKPYLSKYFNWLVLDNLTLSDKKINTIERVFFNSESFQLRQENILNTNVNISNISSTSTYNIDNNYWTSWIDLEITNNNQNNFFSEYATIIDLPNGTWINDYYLYVGDKKEMGILAEKKSAMWVFSQIRGENRDPGLLHYLTGNRVSFRVFPFAGKEVRKTGIKFIHKEPITLTIDNHSVKLGDSVQQRETVTLVEKNDVAYISSKAKSNLTQVNRAPYYHFIVDVSAEKENLKDNYASTINLFLKKNKLNANHKISFTNTYTETINYDTNWETILKQQTFEGGFYLDRAFKHIFYNSQKNVNDTYPIIVVVTDVLSNAVISNNYQDFKFAFPESDLFYHLNTLSYLASHDLTTYPKQFIDDDTSIALNQPVLAWPNATKPLAYLPITSSPDIVLKSTNFKIDSNEIDSYWSSGLLMQGQLRSNLIHPENTENDWNSLVKYSFMSRIMTPLTSYIVVENEAQKAILKQKQEDVLSGKKSLDLNEDTQRMSEPEFLLVLLLFGLFMLFKKRKVTLF
nr:MSEP-CTERM sorting domain-containing protein [uncultured Psychroserpens sp.]